MTSARPSTPVPSGPCRREFRTRSTSRRRLRRAGLMAVPVRPSREHGSRRVQPIVGGATGISAGAAWVPNHGFSTEQLQVEDDLDKARRYLYGEGRDEILDHGIVEKFLETGPHVVRFIEEHTSFGWIPAIWPDYRSDIDGASVGRALFPGPFDPERLGEARQTCDRPCRPAWPGTPSRSGCWPGWTARTSGWPDRRWSARFWRGA